MTAVTESTIVSEFRQLQLASNASKSATYEDATFLESFYVFSLFPKRRQEVEVAQAIPHLIMGLKSTNPRVVEFSARILSLFATDGDKNLKAQGCCKLASESLERTSQTEALVAIVGLIYWLAQDVESKRELVDIGTETRLKEILECMSDMQLTKTIHHALCALTGSVKTRGELHEQTQSHKASESQKPNPRNLFPRTPLQLPPTTQHRPLLSNSPLLSSPLGGFLPKLALTPSSISSSREATPSPAPLTAIDQLLHMCGAEPTRSRSSSTLSEAPKSSYQSILRFKNLPEDSNPRSPPPANRRRGASIKLSSISNSSVDPEAEVPLALVVSARKDGPSESGPKGILEEPSEHMVERTLHRAEFVVPSESTQVEIPSHEDPRELVEADDAGGVVLASTPAFVPRRLHWAITNEEASGPLEY